MEDWKRRGGKGGKGESWGEEHVENTIKRERERERERESKQMRLGS